MRETEKAPDRRVIKTKRAIKNAFARLLAEKDINDITISDIAELADINRKTFYNYYAGVYEIVDEIENDIAAAFDSVLTDSDIKSNLDTPLKAFEKLTTIINTDLDFFGWLLSMESNTNFSIKIVNLLKTKIRTLVIPYVPVSEKKVDLMLDFTMSGLVAVYQHWFNSDRRDSLDEISESIYHLCFQGIPAYLEMENLEDGIRELKEES